ncbi:MAG: nucleoside hydrolase [Erysipelotrichaceae bacterium]|nr:nucleoside hydrolase [Erysipelotrichaceae bacterium]
MKRRPFIIDCDTGTDDAIALVAALGCDEMDIIGITSVKVNVSEQFTSHNNLDLMEYFGHDIPICHGAWLPLLANPDTAAGTAVHGARGLGSITLPEASHSTFDTRIASQFIYETALEYGSELEILATGPLTNLAITYIEHPDIRDHIKHIYFMGGAAIGGNYNTTAEFNIWVDPEASHTVKMSGIPLTMVGLDVTNLAYMRPEEEQKIRALNTRESELVADLLVYQMNRPGQDIPYARMHDPLSLAAAMFPQCLKCTEYFVDTEYFGRYTRGHTAVDFKDRQKKEPNVSVALEVDVPLFRQWLYERIAEAGKKGEAIRRNAQ